MAALLVYATPLTCRGLPHTTLLDSTPARSLTAHVGWAGGVCDALGWLLQVTDRAPVPIPVRGPDGRPAGAEALFEERIRRHHRPDPERRQAAWAAAQRDAARYARLAALAESVTS